jgi:subtilisin family serine protease
MRTTRSVADTLFKHYTSAPVKDIESNYSSAWRDTVKMHGYHNEPLLCDLPASAEVGYVTHSIEIVDLSGISMKCIIHLVHHAVQHPSVLRVLIHSRPTLMNYEAKGLTESAHVRVEPYREAGLTGAGHICGVGDSGVNDISCFFLDDSKAYSTVTTARTGELQPLRRKVIQYMAYADSTEDEAGHGTHVCGSIGKLLPIQKHNL